MPGSDELSASPFTEACDGKARTLIRVGAEGGAAELRSIDTQADWRFRVETGASSRAALTGGDARAETSAQHAGARCA